MPYNIAIFIGDLKLTPGKLAITLLILPATLYLIEGAIQQRRRLMASDLFALAVAVWSCIGPIVASGLDALGGALSQALEFFGPYVIGRLFFFGESSLQEFTRAIKIIAVATFALALSDTLLQQHFINNLLADIFNVPNNLDLEGEDSYHLFHRAILGINLFRAESTFDHPILYGSFCSATAVILAYGESRVTLRLLYLGICTAGCILAVSSGPLLALAVSFCVLCYDGLLRQYLWRWKVLLLAFLGAILALNLLSDNPVSFVLRNLTLDPQTGYYRLMMWDAAFSQIGLNPLIGTGFKPTGIHILDVSIDSFWIAKAMSLGIPVIVFLFLAGVFAIAPARGERRVRANNPTIDRMSTAFSLVLTMFAFTWFTVSFWNGIWLFSALCLGIRVSLKEYCLMVAAGQMDSRQWVSPRKFVTEGLVRS